MCLAARKPAIRLRSWNALCIIVFHQEGLTECVGSTDWIGAIVWVVGCDRCLRARLRRGGVGSIFRIGGDGISVAPRVVAVADLAVSGRTYPGTDCAQLPCGWLLIVCRIGIVNIQALSDHCTSSILYLLARGQTLKVYTRASFWEIIGGSGSIGRPIISAPYLFCPRR